MAGASAAGEVGARSQAERAKAAAELDRQLRTAIQRAASDRKRRAASFERHGKGWHKFA